MKTVVDLKYVLAVARDCGKHINDYLLVVTKKYGSCRYFCKTGITRRVE
jgi:hypothetical protein